MDAGPEAVFVFLPAGSSAADGKLYNVEFDVQQFVNDSGKTR